MIFSFEDIKQCFGYDKDTAVYTKIRRLTDDGVAEKILSGKDKGKYRKKEKLII